MKPLWIPIATSLTIRFALSAHSDTILTKITNVLRPIPIVQLSMKKMAIVQVATQVLPFLKENAFDKQPNQSIPTVISSMPITIA